MIFLHLQVLKPGGMVLFRDYGLNDHAMLRFSKGHKLADSFYVRQDGTRAFFFSLGESREDRIHQTNVHKLQIFKI